MYEGLNARSKVYLSKVYLSKVYFCKMYPACVSSKLCKFIFTRGCPYNTDSSEEWYLFNWSIHIRFLFLWFWFSCILISNWDAHLSAIHIHPLISSTEKCTFKITNHSQFCDLLWFWVTAHDSELKAACFWNQTIHSKHDF